MHLPIVTLIPLTLLTISVAVLLHEYMPRSHAVNTASLAFCSVPCVLELPGGEDKADDLVCLLKVKVEATIGRLKNRSLGIDSIRGEEILSGAQSAVEDAPSVLKGL